MAIAAVDTAVSDGDERAAEDAASESGASPDVIAFAGIGAGEGAEAAQIVQEGDREPTPGIDNGAQQDGDDGAQQDGDEAPPDSQPFS